MKISKLTNIKHRYTRLHSDRDIAKYLKSRLDLRIKFDTFAKNSKINKGKK